MMYDTADINRNNSRLLAMAEIMRNLPEGVASVENDWDAGTRTYVYKDGFRITRRVNESINMKPSASRRVKSSAASELKASLQKTMREADQNISDFIKRIAQLDVEINRLAMRGQYAGTMHKRSASVFDSFQLVNSLNQISAHVLHSA